MVHLKESRTSVNLSLKLSQLSASYKKWKLVSHHKTALTFHFKASKNSVFIVTQTCLKKKLRHSFTNERSKQCETVILRKKIHIWESNFTHSIAKNGERGDLFMFLFFLNQDRCLVTKPQSFSTTIHL